MVPGVVMVPPDTSTMPPVMPLEVRLLPPTSMVPPVLVMLNVPVERAPVRLSVPVLVMSLAVPFVLMVPAVESVPVAVKVPMVRPAPLPVTELVLEAVRVVAVPLAVIDPPESIRATPVMDDEMEPPVETETVPPEMEVDVRP